MVDKHRPSPLYSTIKLRLITLGGCAPWEVVHRNVFAIDGIEVAGIGGWWFMCAAAVMLLVLPALYRCCGSDGSYAR